MKKVYTVIIPILFLLITACKKDKTNSYDNRLIGRTWELYEVHAPNYINPPFTNGFFTFKWGGRLEYTNMNGESYKGSWYTHYHNDTQSKLLYISVNNMNNVPTTMDVYDHIQFTGNDHFIAHISTLNEPNKFYFKR
jgi:hypothetical protein